MNKKADFEQAGQGLKDWYSNLNPDVRSGILRGLAGAAVGGAATGGIAAATPHDPADRKAVVNPALMGALLGGTGAALAPVGAKLLSGGIHFAGEPKRPAGAKVVEALGAPIVNHPLATLALALGLYKGRNSISTLSRGMNQHEGHAVSRFAKAWRDEKHWEDAANKHTAVSRARLMSIPAVAGLGAIGDKYLKGEY